MSRTSRHLALPLLLLVLGLVAVPPARAAEPPTPLAVLGSHLAAWVHALWPWPAAGTVPGAAVPSAGQAATGAPPTAGAAARPAGGARHHLGSLGPAGCTNPAADPNGCVPG